ncbi:MAG: flagellar export chaperone FliS [Desulfobacteraceae bacterium]|jgi:flagellar protein FliS
MSPHGYAGAYSKIQVQSTERKEDVVLLLFEEAIKRVRQARAGIEAGSPKIRGENISRALAIVSELDCALDRTLNLDMVDNLSRLYQYLIQQMTVANVQNDVSALDPVESILKDLHEAFQQAALEVRTAEAGASDQAPAPSAALEGGLRAAI